MASAPETRSARGRYRFALRGRWLVGHVIVLVVAVTFVRLGIWQLDRLDERRARNDRIEAARSSPPVDVRDIAGDIAGAVDATAVEHRSVTATGTYDGARQVRVQLRSFRGQPGDWVLTPLRLDGGVAVVVNRGWVPQGTPVTAFEPSAARVMVSGIVRVSQRRGRFGPRDPATGTLRAINRVDVERLQQQTPYDLLPFYVQLQRQAPSSDVLPRPLPPPELGDGPHLSYAFQWFAFTAVGLIGWPLLIRRAASRPRRGDDRQ